MNNAEYRTFVLKGDICYSKTPTELETVPGGCAVCVDGTSKGVYRTLPEEYRHLPVADYSGMLVFPGLVDLHIHAPQYAFRGMGMDMELMEWLQKQTFPEESKYSDLSYAHGAYGQFAEAMRGSATTHACVFATRHSEATLLLMAYLERTGLISYVGKVNMDQDAPDSLREASAAASLADTENWLSQAERFQRTRPILTPRFVPCCTSELLEGLGALQERTGLSVQSHLSENPGEVEVVRRLHPDSGCYGGVYDRYGLFGRDRQGRAVPTIMAHCVYSAGEELDLLRENGVYVAHCPASNTDLASGIAPVRRFMEAGVRVGLGTDVAGGHSDSILQAACSAVQVSKLYWRLVDQGAKPLTFREAFYLATKGGGGFFGPVGSLESGYEFSAVVLDDSALRHPFPLSVEQRLERAAYSGLDLYGLRAKYAAGRRVC